MSTLRRAACEFWGQNEKHYRFFDEAGNLLESESQVSYVEKHFELNRAKSAAQLKLATLYLGKNEGVNLKKAIEQMGKNKLKVQNE